MRFFNKQQLDAEKNPDYNASVSASLNETSLNANDWNVTKLTASNFTYDKENAPDGTLKKQDGDYQPKSNFERILHDIMNISATVIVDRENLKKIIIGKNGSMIKEIGTRARRDIEAYFDKKVYLELFVKVIPKWRDKEKFLNMIGYKDFLNK